MHRAATVPSASELLREMWPQGSVCERIRAAARELRWPYSRTKDLWYAEARTIHGEETVRLIEVRTAKEAARKSAIEEARNEQDDLIARLARMEDALSLLLARVESREAS